MSPKPDVSAERIPQILDAAVQVFSAHGLANARMDDIARAAGLSKGTLYLYFDSRDAIIEALMESFLARELDKTQALIFSPIPAPEKLMQVAQVMIEDLSKLQPYVPLYFEFIALSLRTPRVQSFIRRFFTKFLDQIEALIRQGIEAKAFRAAHARDAALTVCAIFEGTILLWVYAPDEVDMETQIRSGLQLLLEGLELQGE